MSKEESEIICFICEKAESEPTRIIECLYCNKSCHFRCKKLYGNAIAKARAKPFLCSTECAEMFTRSSHPTANDDVMTELRCISQSISEMKEESFHVRAALEATKSQIATLVESNKNIEESQIFLANQFDSLQAGFEDFKKELNVLKGENKQLKKSINECENKNLELALTVQTLELELDKINRSQLAKNAVILGLPTEENENTKEIVQKVMKAVGVDCKNDDIKSVKRIRSKVASSGAPIVVQFENENVKEVFFEKKRTHGVLMASNVQETFSGSTNRITVRDEITSYGKELMREAKNMQSALNWKYVWMGRGGKVLIKRRDGAKVEPISSKADLEKLSKTANKRAPDSSLNLSSLSTPSPFAPSPKRFLSRN